MTGHAPEADRPDADPAAAEADPAAAGGLADRIAAAAAACPGVAGLATGPVATYLPGRTVPGVAVRDGTVRIAIVARYGPVLPDVAERVRAAVHPLAPGWTVDVHVDDVEVPAGQRDGAGRGAAP